MIGVAVRPSTDMARQVSTVMVGEAGTASSHTGDCKVSC